MGNKTPTASTAVSGLKTPTFLECVLAGTSFSTDLCRLIVAYMGSQFYASKALDEFICQHTRQQMYSVAQEPHAFIVRLSVFGAPMVGKNTLVRSSWTDDTPTDVMSLPYVPTLSQDVSIRSIRICKNNTVVKAQIWDFSGQDRDRMLRHEANYNKQVHGMMFVMDVYDKKSLDYVRNKRTEVECFRDSSYDVPVCVLVGNHKIRHPDQVSHRQIAFEDASALATEWGWSYFEVDPHLDPDEPNSAHWPFCFLIDACATNMLNVLQTLTV